MKPLITQKEWIDLCASQYFVRAGLTSAQAYIYADATAGAEREQNGPDVTRWTEPKEAADIDMSYWEDDEGSPE